MPDGRLRGNGMISSAKARGGRGSGGPGTRSTASPPDGGDARFERAFGHPLPAALSSFLGRGREISRVRELLEASRLVTLTGAPGIGKTRLALEVAGGPRGETGGRTALVELAPIGDPALVARAVAAVLSVQAVPGSTLIEALVAGLRERQLLLVLDNCEHLVGACAEVVGALLSGCPQLRVLTTSREPLAIAGEQVWQVPPLSVPGPREQPQPEALMLYDGVRLFVERAEAVQPDFVLSGEVAPAVVEITWRLDGIPLAIELAATRVDALTPLEIARRLDDRFGLLTKGARNGLARHQTLRAALDWSHELLSAPERALLRRLSVFVGGFCLQAAEAVCSGGEVQSTEVFDLLAGLVSKSLVVSDTANSRGRYRLLETIRAYTADRLEEAGEAPVLGRAHAAFYLALAERAEPELTGADQQRWLERLDSERENVRFALHWSLGHRQTEWALRLAGALVLFWRVRCHFSEGRELLEAAARASEDNGAPALRAKVLWGVGFMALMAGDAEAAVPALEQSLAGFRELHDLQGCARTLLILGNTHVVLGNPSAPAVLEESADLAREAGDQWCLAHALGLTGYAHMVHTDLPAARPLFEGCIGVAREAHDKQGLRFGLIGLGRVALNQGDYGSAEALLEETLSIARELGEAYVEATALHDLGELALGRGDYARARERFEEAQAVLPELAREDEAVLGPLLGLARVAHAEGDLIRARLLVDEALATIPPPRTSIPALQHLGELAAEEGDADRARCLFQEALEYARKSGDRWLSARALHGLGQLARAAEEAKRAMGLHVEALELQRQLGDKPGIAASLEALAGLVAASGRHPQAARLFGAADGLRRRGGYARVPWEVSRYETDVNVVREELSADELEVAFAEGTRLSIEEAMTQAVKGRRRRGRPITGWASLTDTEQQLTALVAQGLTNRQIAQRQLISPGTVKAHLSHIFAKLGVAGRRELAQEAWQRQQQHRWEEAQSSQGR